MSGSLSLCMKSERPFRRNMSAAGDAAGPRGRHRARQRRGRLCPWPRRNGGRSISVETSTPKARAFVEALAGLRRASRRRLFADFARVEGDRERRGSSESSDAAHERAVPGRYPGSLAVEPSHDQLRRAGGCRRDPSRDRHSSTTIPLPSSSRRCFLPFLSEVLAVSFGLWSRDRRLICARAAGRCRQHGAGVRGGSRRRRDPGRPDSFHGFQESAGELRHLGGDRRHRRSFECGRHRPPLSHWRRGRRPAGHFPGLAGSRVRLSGLPTDRKFSGRALAAS